MNCHEIEIELSAYLDGELNPAEAESVEAHLAECERCRGQLEQLRAARAAFRALAPTAATATLRRQVMSAARTTPLPRQRRRLWWAPAAAAATVAMWLFLAPDGTPPTTLEITGPGAGPEVYRHLVSHDPGASGELPGLGKGTERPGLDAGAIGALPGSLLY